MFTCVGWQVTLCDPVWQVMSHGCEMGVPLTAIGSFTFLGVKERGSERCDGNTINKTGYQYHN